MRGLDPRIHWLVIEGMDARTKSGHDDN